MGGEETTKEAAEAEETEEAKEVEELHSKVDNY